jgi:hypothetical protein
MGGGQHNGRGQPFILAIGADALHGADGAGGGRGDAHHAKASRRHRQWAAAGGRAGRGRRTLAGAREHLAAEDIAEGPRAELLPEAVGEGRVVRGHPRVFSFATMRTP